jgi:NHL repeat-containing protein
MNWGRKNGTAGAALIVVLSLVLVALCALASAASADSRLCSPGSAPGQCKEPTGVATDWESGHVYVADTQNNRIDVFLANGTFLFSFGEGQLSAPRTITVDNNPASSSFHDVYVVDNSFRVQKFDSEGHFLLAFGWGVANGAAEAQTCGPAALPPTVTCFSGIKGGGECQVSRNDAGIAIGPSGDVLVADNFLIPDSSPEEFKARVEKFDQSGSCVEETVLFESKDRLFGSFAVDSSEDLYLDVFDVEHGERIRKYDASGTALCDIDVGMETTALAVDPADDLFAAQREAKVGGEGSVRMISEFDSSCNHLRRFGYGSIAFNEAVRGLAFYHSAQGDVFVSESVSGVNYLSIPPPGPFIVPPSVQASMISNTKATLTAEINPEGKATTSYAEYIEQAACEKNLTEAKDCFEGATKGTPQSLGAEDFSLQLASTQFGCFVDPVAEFHAVGSKCLKPQTKYRFRVFAENADGEGNSPIDGGSFETLPFLEIGATWATGVGFDSAQLHAEVNPLGIDTTGYFEYVDDAHFQESGFATAAKVPNVGGGQAPIDFGSGESLVERSISVGLLAPNTTYHYRLVAEDPLSGPINGPAQTFRTFGRAAEACPANEAFRIGPSALLPDCRAYEMVSPLDKANGDIVVTRDFGTNARTVLNQSAVSGLRLAYGSARAFGEAPSAPGTSQYITARGEEGWHSHSISPPRGRPILAVTGSLDTEFKAFSPDLCEAFLRTAAEPVLAAGAQAGYTNLYRKVDTECGGPSYEALTTAAWPNLESPLVSGRQEVGELEFQGSSSDGSSTIFIAPDSLTGSGAPPQSPNCISKEEGCRLELYVKTSGSAHPVFVCVLPNGNLSQTCSAGQGGARAFTGRNRHAVVQGAISIDGERIFWTDSGEGAGKIYMREHAEQGKVAEECTSGKACTIAISEEGEELSGTTNSRFRAAATDGSEAVFTTGAGGKEDLYHFEAGANATQLIGHEVIGLVGVSANTSHIYFVSREVLGGMNAEGDTAQDGEANLYLWAAGAVSFIGTLSPSDSGTEASPISPPYLHLARVSADGLQAVFMSNAPLTSYDNTDANSGEADDEVFLYNASSGKLICASCNPSGSRPLGEDIGHSIILPGSTHWTAAFIPPYENTLYAPRVLADDGNRLFFGSSDALVARDTNGQQDVYEWEAPGVGGCTAESSAFSPQNEGCVDLISSGQSSRGSEFLDASPSGDDVFFTTLASLLPQDFGLVDIYDARIGGGFPPPPQQASECEGEACQSPPEPPQAPTPATSTRGASGQVLPKGCPKGRKAVVRKGKRKCLAKHRKRHRHHKARAGRRNRR